MSEPTDTLAPETPAAEAAKAKKASRLPKVIVAVCVVIGLLLGLGIGITRYGVLLPQGRLLIEARTDGLKLGRFGKLQIRGLSGDLWRDFNIRTLTVSDDKGVWLEAHDLHVEWSYLALFQRRFQADEITAQQVRVLRRPTMEPSKPSKGLPISFDIDAMRARIEMLPEFSTRRGVYDVSGQLEVGRRNSGQSGLILARSVLHPGDKLDVRFNFGGERPLVLKAQALEAQGGALAGALGLPADRTFALDVDAGGKMSGGRFTAVAAVGSDRPLEAKGAWNPEGGQADGRLSLTASTLTKPFAERFGPEVVFKASGVKAGPGLHQLDVTLDAENLTATASGQANLGERRTGPRGVAITVSTPKMGRILPAPEMGSAQIGGVLTGDASDLKLAGNLAVQRLALGGYSLRRVSGPFTLTRNKQGLTVAASPRGEGGAGSELFAAMLGGAPRADLQVQQLTDGRWLFRRLNVAGSGLKVEASGDRNLLGGLNFKGDVRVSNLKAARIGASGGVAGSWKAAQARGGAPWTFSVDARGQGFASGFSELDRLLGASPVLQAQANFADGKVSISRARLEGAAMQANAAGAFGPNGKLAIKTDWSAKGPFRAGPVEITGAAKGTGGITGTASAPRVDLIADVDAIDLPQLPLTKAHITLTFMQAKGGASGTATLAAGSAYGPAKAAGDFRFPRGGVDLSNVVVDAAGVKARGAISLRRSTPSAADLILAIGPGALLDAGSVAGKARIVDSAGGPRADLDLTVDRARPKGAPVFVRAGKLTADGPLDRLPYVLEANGASRAGRWRVNGQGIFSDEKDGRGLTFAGEGRLGRRDMRTVEPAVLRFGGGAQSARLRLAATGGGLVNLDARLAGDAADIEAQVAKLDLQLFNEDLDGTIDAKATLEGRGSNLSGLMDARLTDARGRGTDTSLGLDGVLTARLEGDELTLKGGATNDQGLKASVDLTLPAEASAKPLRLAINRQRPMRGQVLADGEVKPLWDLLVGGERRLSGQVHVEGTLGGTLADPTATGLASVDGGRFEDGATGLVLQDVVLRAGLARNAIDITQASGRDGRGGTLDGGGRISLARNGASSFRLTLSRFRLIDNDMATAIASGQATIDRGGDGKVRLAGDVLIDEAEVAANPPTPSGVVTMDVIERNRPRDFRDEVAPKASGGGAVALDVKLRAPRRVFIRGRGLDLEMALDAHVGGTTAAPLLTGVARVVRGDYDFAGKRFEFDDRGTVQLSTNPAAIRLDLEATREDPSLTAVVRIRGTAAKPEITLTSNPVLPNDEVLSQVLFGRSASQLSPLEAAQLASALSALAGGGGFDVIGGLRSFAGLDRLALVGGDESGFAVAGGKYLTEDIYLEIIGGGREGPAAQVEWRFSRSLSFLSKLTGQGDTRLSVRWRRDY